MRLIPNLLLLLIASAASAADYDIMHYGAMADTTRFCYGSSGKAHFDSFEQKVLE